MGSTAIELTPNRPATITRSFGTTQFRVDEQPASDNPKTRHTIARMVRLAIADSTSAAIRSLARAITTGRGAGSSVDKIFYWVKRNVTFRPDSVVARELGLPPESEILIRPVDLIAMDRPRGDCDDFSMLTAALLIACGYPAWYKAIAADDDDPSYFSHVFVLTREQNEIIPLDTSHGPYPGVEARAVGKTRVFPVEDEGGHQMKGFGDWQEVVLPAEQTGLNILSARLAVPPPGTYISETTPSGSRVIQTGGATAAFPPAAASGSWIMYGLLALAALAAVAHLSQQTR